MDSPICERDVYFPIPRQLMYRVQKHHHFRRMKWLGVISDETLHIMNGGGHHGLFMVACIKKVLNICVMGLFLYSNESSWPTTTLITTRCSVDLNQQT